jgi:hypothetical protein
MRPSFLVLLACATVVPVFACGVRAATDDGKPLGEDEKIKALIETVRTLKDATFIRNGDEYDCKAAAQHMERKWKAGRKEIKTARDFIELAASKSSRSGEPYRIRFKDGKEQNSGAFLTAELDRLEGKPAKDAKSKSRSDARAPVPHSVMPR